VNDRAGAAKQRDLGIVDVATVRRKQPGAEEVVLGEILRRAKAMVAQHVLHLPGTLGEVDRVSEIVLLRKVADGVQELRR